jgi:exosortase
MHSIFHWGEAYSSGVGSENRMGCKSVSYSKMNSTTTNHSTLISTSLFATLFASFILAYFPVWRGLVLAWYSNDQYSHGFLIVPLCIYMLWRKKEKLAEIQIRPSQWGLALTIFSLLLYLFAHLAEITTVASFSMVLLLAGVIIYFYGFPMLKELLFPLFILLFMIPIPAQIYSKLTIPLQLFVSKASVWIGTNMGLPIYREGNVIHLPDQTLQVVQACSGLRSMMSLLALSAFFGYFTLKSNTLRIILFLCGIPAAILVNIIRVLLSETSV